MSGDHHDVWRWWARFVGVGATFEWVRTRSLVHVAYYEKDKTKKQKHKQKRRTKGSRRVLKTRLEPADVVVCEGVMPVVTRREGLKKDENEC